MPRNTNLDLIVQENQATISLSGIIFLLSTISLEKELVFDNNRPKTNSLVWGNRTETLAKDLKIA